MLVHLDPRYWLACCVRCGVRGGVLCPDCLRLPLEACRTPGGLTVHGLGHYTGRLGECVRRLKYRDETHLAFPLGRALRTLAERSGLFQGRPLLLPVPLHPMRLAERGYNQSALVGRHVASPHGARLVTSCLFRSEVRRAQATLSGAERRTNMLGVFRADAPRDRRLERPGPRVEVFLLDDVVTTGSTADACAAALAQVGVSVGAVLACAIAGDAEGPAPLDSPS